MKERVNGLTFIAKNVSDKSKLKIKALFEAKDKYFKKVISDYNKGLIK